MFMSMIELKTRRLTISRNKFNQYLSSQFIYIYIYIFIYLFIYLFIFIYIHIYVKVV